MKLMIIDNHAGVRTLIRQLAATPDDAVCECASGDEAVTAARVFRPDCITMDIRMPGMNGIEATRALCAEHPAARVVIVSDFDQPDIRTAAAAAGARGYVSKGNLAGLRVGLRAGQWPGTLTNLAAGRAWSQREGSIGLG